MNTEVTKSTTFGEDFALNISSSPGVIGLLEGEMKEHSLIGKLKHRKDLFMALRYCSSGKLINGVTGVWEEHSLAEYENHSTSPLDPMLSFKGKDKSQWLDRIAKT